MVTFFYFLGYLSATYFGDMFFMLSIIFSYTFIYHSEFLRRRKIQEYVGLSVIAFTIAFSLIAGLYLVSSGQKSKLNVEMKRAPVKAVMDASRLAVVSGIQSIHVVD